MTDIIRALQVLFVLAWTVPLILFVRPAFTRARNGCDSLAAATWFASLSIVAFPLRWLLQGNPARLPHSDMVLWAALYVAGSFAAVKLSKAVRGVCNGHI